MWGKRKSDHEQEASAAGGAPPSPQVPSANDQLLGTQSPAGLDAKPRPNGIEPNVADGVVGTETPAVPNRAGQGPTADEIRFAVTFTRIVSVLTRSRHYKHYTLSDLEWLVAPPILTGQCAVMEATVNGRQVPVAIALWANVSEDVDNRLSGSLTAPIRLRPDEWRCGDVLWLIDAVGDVKAIPQLLEQLKATTFTGRVAKMRTQGPNSRPAVATLGGVPTDPHAAAASS
jgi:cytolysin-activating lysine-acyltransferase